MTNNDFTNFTLITVQLNLTTFLNTFSIFISSTLLRVQYTDTCLCNFRWRNIFEIIDFKQKIQSISDTWKEMDRTKFFTFLILLLQLRNILSTEKDEQNNKSCSEYQTYMEGLQLQPKIQQQICDILRRYKYDNGSEHTQSLEQRNDKKPSQYEVWGYGFMMVTFIR